MAYTATKYEKLAIMNPGMGGLNIQDMEYTLNVAQSPNMVNMMYKNGVFGKRYGQAKISEMESSTDAIHRYRNRIYVHADGKFYYYDIDTNTVNEIIIDKTETTVFNKSGFFFTFGKMLYFLSEEIYLEWEENGNTTYLAKSFHPVKPYIPTLVINRKPDGTTSDVIDNYNMIGRGFQNHFNGDGTSKEYHLTEDNLASDLVTCVVETVEHTEGDGSFTVDRTNGVITFSTAPVKGQNNVEITAYMSPYDEESEEEDYEGLIYGCKFAIAFGGSNNSHLFLAGNGTSEYYYSGTEDASYFPELNRGTCGNTEDDITGFGKQYNVLIVFKANDIYSMTYNFGTDSNGDTSYRFDSKPVNDQIGCDVPGSIKYIDNRLTWVNSNHGVCTLCSTNIVDERNIRAISRNIDGGFRHKGMLGESDILNAKAYDYDGKYIVSVGSVAYVWDYRLAPYAENSTKYSLEERAEATAWFYWENLGYEGLGISDGVVCNGVFYYLSGKNICKFTRNLNDFGHVIHAVYESPMFDFNAFEYLKTIKRAFFEVRGDTASYTRITYITDEDANGEEDPEPIAIGGSSWASFGWNTFSWTLKKYAEIFARKCSVKKVAMFGIKLESGMNDTEKNMDMNVSSIKLEYTIVKEIK